MRGHFTNDATLATLNSGTIISAVPAALLPHWFTFICLQYQRLYPKLQKLHFRGKFCCKDVYLPPRQQNSFGRAKASSEKKPFC
jgi:hypothetical protein